MVFRLVIDAIRRKWIIGAFAVFQINVISDGVSRFWPSVNEMALTMSSAWWMSMIVGEVFSSRVHFQLPVSRRTWWLARWWMCVGFTVVIAQVSILILQWRSGAPWLGVEPVLLSMTFGILYCGVSMAARTTSLGKSADAPGTFLSGVVFLPVMIGFVAAPFLLSPYLPHAFSDLHATWFVVLLVMAVFTVVGYRHHPEITARPDMRLARRISSVTPNASDSSAAPRIDLSPAGFAARLTGAKMVLWEESRKQLIIFSTVIAMGIAWWAIGSQYRVWPALSAVLREASMLPFVSSRAHVTEPIIFPFLFVVAIFADVWMTSRIRSLRTLPLSSTQLGSLPVVLGLVSASMLWIVLLVLHGLVLRTLPSSLRPGLFTAFAAMTAMAHTVRFVTPGHAVVRSMLGLVPFLIIFLPVAYLDDPKQANLAQSTLLVGGLVTLAASWALMRFAVTRSSSMYRPRPAVPTA